MMCQVSTKSISQTATKTSWEKNQRRSTMRRVMIVLSVLAIVAFVAVAKRQPPAGLDKSI